MASRRKSIELTAEERRAFLAEKKTIIIVSNGKNGYPHPMPMWFHVDDDGCVYCTTFAKSQKVFNYRRDPRASLLVESGIEYAELKGVVIYADVEIIEDTELVIDTLASINAGGEQLTPEQREGMRRSAEKRVALKFTPRQYVSWDHAKLGGVY